MTSVLPLLLILVTLFSANLVFMSPILHEAAKYPTTNVKTRILTNDSRNLSSSNEAAASLGSSHSLLLENIKRRRRQFFQLSKNRAWRKQGLLEEETLTCDQANKLRNDSPDAVTLPPDVCGLCPQAGPEGGLYPCTCVNNGGSLGGTISIDCPPEVSSQEILRDILQRTEFLTTNVSRFSMTESNITGVLDLKMLSPLTVRVLILDDDQFLDVDNHAFNSSDHTLTTISVANNLIAYFHFDSVATIPLLKTLDLSGNLLNFIPTQAFIHPELQILNLSNNNIYTVSSEAFLGLASVEIIDLSSNNLSELQQNTFKITDHDVNKVLEIDISNNFLRYISPDAFADLNNLQVNLSNNELTTLDEAVFKNPIENSGYFAQFIVEGNPINCDCEIYWIIVNSLYTNCFDNFHCHDINATLYQLNPDDYLTCSTSHDPRENYLQGIGFSRLPGSDASGRESVVDTGHRRPPPTIMSGNTLVIGVSKEGRVVRRGEGNYLANYVASIDPSDAYVSELTGLKKTKYWLDSDYLREQLGKLW